MADHTQVGSSQAAMRLVAQTTFYNRGDQERLIGFIGEAYAPNLLEQQSAIEKAAAFANMRRVLGRIKVQKWIVMDKHSIVARMESEQGVRFVVEMMCADEYPHKITYYMQHPSSG
jgi:hypothetical protein